ncbi:hypothetical protein X728_26390 [Mesorhizobium sp. L103C120A0]|nr:hypothetical protein X728_26390 [Mesorhizobium sp. L103C120A0]
MITEITLPIIKEKHQRLRAAGLPKRAPEDRRQPRHDGIPLWRRRSSGTAARPKDESKVENGVRFAQSCILGLAAHLIFFSLAEANAAIRQALDRINDHVMRRLGVSRRRVALDTPTRTAPPRPTEDTSLRDQWNKN